MTIWNQILALLRYAGTIALVVMASSIGQASPFSHEYSKKFTVDNLRYVVLDASRSDLATAVKKFAAGETVRFENPSQAADGKAYWAKLTVESGSAKAVYLSNHHPSTDYMEVFHLQDDGGYQRQISGDSSESHKRYVASRLPTVKLDLRQGSNTVYVVLRSSVIVRLSFDLMSENAFHTKKSREDIFIGLSMGITISLFSLQFIPCYQPSRYQLLLLLRFYGLR